MGFITLHHCSLYIMLPINKKSDIHQLNINKLSLPKDAFVVFLTTIPYMVEVLRESPPCLSYFVERCGSPLNNCMIESKCHPRIHYATLKRTLNFPFLLDIACLCSFSPDKNFRIKWVKTFAKYTNRYPCKLIVLYSM